LLLRWLTSDKVPLVPVVTVSEAHVRNMMLLLGENAIIGNDGEPVMRQATRPKYGLHALRHFFASWVIERRFTPKRVQVLLGRSSIQMTFDVYGHLFPSLEDDHAKFAAGEQSLLSSAAG
jgi:integrase